MGLKTLSVSEVNNYIKRILQYDPILNNLTVKGEISNFKLHNSGHCYFSIKDQDSKIRCVMFRGDFQHVTFRPKDGMSVIMKGNISVYEKNGDYQLYVRSMEQDGLGKLHVEFERLKKELELKGYFNPMLKQEISRFPSKIGVVTSATGAAIRDILSVINRRCKAVDILIVPVLVQGDYAASQISAAIDLLNRRDDIDTIIISRGGGSIEELWAFNELDVVESIFSSEIPIISAVGHETDFTLADFVSDLRAPTPSAAGELAVPNMSDLKSELDYNLSHLLKSIDRRLDTYRERLENYSPHNLKRHIGYQINDNYQSLDFMYSKMELLIKRGFKDKKMQLINLGTQLDQLSPLKTIERGFTYTTDDKGNSIRSIKDIAIGDNINITFKDGRADCKVEALGKEINP